jgi:hypothetical protein
VAAPSAAAIQAAHQAVASVVNDTIPNPIPFKEGADFGIWKQRIIALVLAKRWQNAFQAPPLGPAVAVPPADHDEDTRRADQRQKFYSFLLSSLEDTVLANFRGVLANGEQLFNAMCAEYESSTVSNKIALRYKLTNHKLNESGDVQEYIKKFTEIATKLTTIGDPLTDSDKSLRFMMGLPRSFNALVTAMRLNANITFDEIVRQVKDQAEFDKVKHVDLALMVSSNPNARGSQPPHRGRGGHRRGSGRGRNPYRPNQRRSESGSQFQRSDNSSSSSSSTSGFDSPCGRCGKDHQTKACTFRGECNYCHKPGHMAKYCRKRSKANDRAHVAEESHFESEQPAMQQSYYDSKDEQRDDYSTYSDSTYTVEEEFQVDSESALGATSHSDTSDLSTVTFALDSGATAHYINDLDLLTHVKEVDEPIAVKMANDQAATISKIGSLTVRSQNHGKELRLNEVRYAPSFRVNLLSVGRLSSDGARVMFSENSADLIDHHGHTRLSAARQPNNLFVAQIARSQIVSSKRKPDTSPLRPPPLSSVDPEVSMKSIEAKRVAEPKDAKLMELLHQRLGHLNVNSIQKMINNNSISGTEMVKIDQVKEQCEGCKFGTMHRHTFKSVSSRPRSQHLLQRIFADLSGAVNISIPSAEQHAVFRELGEPRYVSLIIDDFSRHLDVQLLKTKDECSNHIQRFVRYAETQSGHKVKTFVCDGGGEYNNELVHDFFAKKGIHVEMTTPHTPQHNGVAERAMRTVFECARTILYHAKLPLCFWGEAVKHAVHLVNCRPHRALTDNVTPIELFTGFKPDIKHLRVFGCDSFVHVPDEERSKMDKKAIKAIFIGQDQLHGLGNRFFNPDRLKVVISRDAIFEENSFSCGRELLKVDPMKVKEEILIADVIPVRTKHVQVPPSIAAPISSSNIVQKPLHSATDVHSSPSTATRPSLSSNNRSSNRPRSRSRTGSSLAAQSLSHGQSIIRALGLRNPTAVASAAAAASSARSQAASRPIPPTALVPVAQPAAAPGPVVASAGPRPTSIRFILGGGRNSANSGARPASSSSLANFVQEVKEFAFNVLETYPRTFDEAMKSNDSEKWHEAMSDEFKSHLQNKTWTLVKRPPHANVLKGLWVLRKKYKSNGAIERYKARWTAKGYGQKEGVDFFETFAPVLKYKSLRILLVLAAKFDLELKQLDVVTAFLHATVSEKIYVEQPHGFAQGGDNMVCELAKALYGIKQAPNAWNNTLDSFIRFTLKFNRCVNDVCVYFRSTRTGRLIIIAVFVDDMIIAFHRDDEKEWLSIKNLFMSRFKIKDLGDAEFVLGMRVKRNRKERSLLLDQSLYTKKVLERFNALKAKPELTPSSMVKLTKAMSPQSDEERATASKLPYLELVGSLLYAALATRPDITHAVNEVCRFMSAHGQQHWNAAKRILRYLTGTAKAELHYKPYNNTEELRVEAYSDSDWAGDPDNRKSTTGFVVKLDGCTISWNTKKQSIVSLSSAEAEYIALADTAKEVLWVRNLLSELFSGVPIPCTIFGDNQASQIMASNPISNERTKHIDTRFHFIRDKVKNKEFNLEWIPSEHQLADMFTKSLQKTQFIKLRWEVMGPTSTTTMKHEWI